VQAFRLAGRNGPKPRRLEKLALLASRIEAVPAAKLALTLKLLR
jgi:hypothetical protein